MASDPIISWCRHCPTVGPMTKEHLPQRSVGNSGETAAYVHLPSAPNTGPTDRWREGHSAPVLCGPCQERPSKKNFGYTTEFKSWYQFVVNQLRDYVSRNGTDPLEEPYLDIEVSYDRMPGRFVRQIIGNLLAMQDTEQLRASYPCLGVLIGSDPTDPERPHEPLDIAPLRLFMALANRTTLLSRAPMAMMTASIGGCTHRGPYASPGGLSVDMVIPYVVSPFAFVLADCEVQGIDNLRIDHWTQMVVNGAQARLPRRNCVMRVPTLASWRGPLAAAMRVEAGRPG